MAGTKKLYRSKKSRVIAGVCGGIADYLDTDPVLIRVLWVLITIFSGFFPGVIAYLACWIIIPEQKKK